MTAYHTPHFGSYPCTCGRTFPSSSALAYHAEIANSARVGYVHHGRAY